MSDVAQRVLAFFRGRQRDLPWRRSREAYPIWISEIMLQQTRIETVIPYFERWLERFPTVEQLASASEDDVLSAWSGLGYYSRARNIHRCAREVVADYNGELPGDAVSLRALPGIGRYTAGAIASQAYDAREPVVDGNVARVLARFYAIDEDVKSTAGLRRLWALAGELVPADDPGDFNQGLMELGQSVCTPRSPACPGCPLSERCQARLTGRVGELPVLPKRRGKADKPLIDQVALWIEKKRTLLLARRPTTGLYAGLWELPAAASLDELRRGFPTLELDDDEPVTCREQELSHRRLRIRVWRGVLARKPRALRGYLELRWQPLARIGDLGVSSATVAITAAMTDKR